MRLLSIELERFRNIAHAKLELTPAFNVLVGPNGQGKTNTLEAIYLLSALRPLRSVQRRALIAHGEEETKLRARVERASTGLVHDLEMTLTARSRTLAKDEKRCEATAFLGVAVAVAFTPDDLQLPKGGPDARRRFLDRALLNIRPAYLERAMRYARALKDRSRILHEQGPDNVLEAYDQVLSTEGAAIAVARAAYVRELAPRVEKKFEDIATPAPALKLRYESTLGEAVDGEDEKLVREHFLEELGARRATDRRRKTTSVGPHLDELAMTLDRAAVRDRASQGQHRAIVLALKLAEITHLAERLGEPPVLLLDDMSSELDPQRSRQLYEAISRLEGQVLLTGTEEPRSLDRVGAVFDVSEGRIERRA
jgi:DNA replication and repair protein RecF